MNDRQTLKHYVMRLFGPHVLLLVITLREDEEFSMDTSSSKILRATYEIFLDICWRRSWIKYSQPIIYECTVYNLE